MGRGTIPEYRINRDRDGRFVNFMGAKKIYVVRRVYNPGLYYDWVECERQVKGFLRAVFKGFKSLSEVERFLALQ
jgi:hypothetical protein